MRFLNSTSKHKSLLGFSAKICFQALLLAIMAGACSGKPPARTAQTASDNPALQPNGPNGVDAPLDDSPPSEPIPYDINEDERSGTASPAEQAPSNFPRGLMRREESSQKRPGLGTKWGESEYSPVNSVFFERASHYTPNATLTLFYNDSSGIRNMATDHRTYRSEVPMLSGSVSVSILDDESDSPLSGFFSGGRNYIVGNRGQKYAIVLENHSARRFECVLSVDGLDVLDGTSASYNKRGYILAPFGELKVSGFRQNDDEVAAFRFTSVNSSYANQKYGDTRNVGVIGIALFGEREHRRYHRYAEPPPQPSYDMPIRRRANPFPGASFPNELE